MNPKSKKKANRLPIAQQIADLVESIGDGSQRTFATRVGCSQPVISRIVNGQQKPGRDLIARIAKLDGVDGQALLASLDEPMPYDITDDYLIPIATRLLRSAPEPHQLSASTLAVSRAVFRPTIYAVPARSCEPAFSDPSERLRADDLIVMDSSTEDLRLDVQMLHGKLCAVDSADTITLRRVWVKYDPDLKKRAVYTCPDAKVEVYRDQKYGDKPLRSIQLDLPEDVLQAKFVDERIDVSAIVGMAVQLIRNF
jgi:transcriptional regulator with XRE-family HTH domain